MIQRSTCILCKKSFRYKKIGANTNPRKYCDSCVLWKRREKFTINKNNEMLEELKQNNHREAIFGDCESEIL